MTIHVVMGPPASGKSTFVETNAPPGVPRFDFDKIASTIAGEDIKHDSPPAVMDTVLAMRRGLMGWLLDPETSVEELWLINARPSDNTITSLASVGAEFHILDPGEAECIARAEREGRPDGTAERIRQWYLNPPVVPGEKGGVVKTKNFSVSVKADGQDGQGEGVFTGYASVFDNIDSYGDVIRKGAFAESLSDWEASGNVIPVLYNHDFNDPFSNIGSVTSAVEDGRGLKVTAQLDMDNPKAAQVHRLLKAGRLSQMSFAFNVTEGGMAVVDDKDVFEIRGLKLYEVSVVTVGANQETEITDVKAALEELSNAVKRSDEAVKKSVDDDGDLARARAARAQLLILSGGNDEL